jgi:outer membrane receptor for monomeric catechols
VEITPARDWRVLAAWLFSDARVVDAPAQRALEGKRLAQVPEHTVTLGVRYRNPSILTASVTARYVSQAYEDDLNTLPLGDYVVVDVLLARQLTRWAEIFLAVENLFDREYAVARTSEGVTSIGAPRLVRGGLRLTF